jgi:hypothetical protein
MNMWPKYRPLPSIKKWTPDRHLAANAFKSTGRSARFDCVIIAPSTPESARQSSHGLPAFQRLKHHFRFELACMLISF